MIMRARFAALALSLVAAAGAAAPVTNARPIDELKILMRHHLGKTADWVEITDDAVWVGSTGPTAVSRIDPKTNRIIAKVPLPGEPCARLAAGLGSLWVPLCGSTAGLAQVDLQTNRLRAVHAVGPAAAEGGITTSTDSVWMIIDKSGLLARIDPQNGNVRQQIRIPAGSYNPLFYDGKIWVSRADGAEVTILNADDGAIVGSCKTGPGPRFMAAGDGAVWTLNQGDGSLTQIDTRSWQSIGNVELNIPGHGGDIALGQGLLWTTMPTVPLSVIEAKSGRVLAQWQGPGGDSLGFGHGSIWLTDYHGGTISRIDIQATLAHLPRR